MDGSHTFEKAFQAEAAIDPRRRDQLTDEHRALLTDPEVAQRFDALMAECLAETPRFGACGRNPFWIADSTGFTIDACGMAERAEREIRTERAQAAARPADAKIAVLIRQGECRGATNLDALCEHYGLDWGERVAIRSWLATGREYVADHQGGWSKLPKHAVVSAAPSPSFPRLALRAEPGERYEVRT